MKKIIAICTTKFQSKERIEFIDKLYNSLDKSKYKILVFNSHSDAFNSSLCDKGTLETYNIINYDKIDCLILDKNHFMSDLVFYKIINNAKAHKVPVIVINGIVQDCHCVVDDYDHVYKQMIEHLINCHNYKDFFFVAGIKDEISSEKRLALFKDVLLFNNIPFNEDKIAYCNFYEVSVYDLFEKLYSENKLPRVFVCANDTMAFAIYQKAAEHNLVIPDDIAVIGFDGLHYSCFFDPPLATCQKDTDALNNIIINTIQNICYKNINPEIYKSSFKAIIHGSCGCDYSSNDISNNLIFNAFRDFERTIYYQDHSYNIIEKTIDFGSQSNIYELLMECAIPGSSICIKNTFAATMIDNDEEDNKFSDKFFVLENKNISYDNKDSSYIRNEYDFLDMIPNFEEWLKDDTMYFLTSIHAQDLICGHYVTKVSSSIGEAISRFNRTSRTINIIIAEALSRYKQKNANIKNTQALNINTITGLSNLKGLCDWFHTFASYNFNRKKTIMISLYWVPKYKEIYEKYGVKELEQILNYTGETLKIANPNNSCIFHIAEDEFVVVNYVDSQQAVHITINNATNVFFSLKESYIKDKRNEYPDYEELEINCGCTVVDSGWSEDLDILELVKLARTEMFINRFKYGSGITKERIYKEIREDYPALMLLINKNRFIYHYQPIIDIDNQDIYAYEALMRTDSEINLSPMDILKTAEAYGRLYDIEKATIFNIMEQYSNNQDDFKNRKVFINSIPGYFLCDEDVAIIRDKYFKNFNSFVFELTEQSIATDDEVSKIKNLGADCLQIPIAIDDYGAGNSNIVNLLRYKPQIIKIDRFLISDIDKDTNKQMFVKGTIEFASINNIKVLAEGVETRDEFLTVINLGINYVQGYYTGRPSKEPLKNIPDFVINDINSAKNK